MPPSPPYADRRHAGHVLAGALTPRLPDGGEVVVLAMPRGGVAVAAPMAELLRAPLDVLVLHLLSLPGQPDVSMGAVADVGGDVVVLRDEPICRTAGVPGVAFDAAARRATEGVRRQADAYHAGDGRVSVSGKVVVIVDDGLRPRPALVAAVRTVRRRHASHVVVALPVSHADICAAVAAHADDVVCPCTPRRPRCLGDSYHDFTQTTDEQLRTALRDRSSDDRAA